MLEHSANIATIIGVLIAIGTVIGSVLNHSKTKRRLERPEGDTLTALIERRDAVLEARKRYRSRARYQVYQTHAIAGLVIPVVTMSVALMVIVIVALSLDAVVSRNLGYALATVLYVGWLWLGYAIAKIHDERMLLASDFDRIASLNERISVMEAHPLD